MSTAERRAPLLSAEIPPSPPLFRDSLYSRGFPHLELALTNRRRDGEGWGLRVGVLRGRRDLPPRRARRPDSGSVVFFVLEERKCLRGSAGGGARPFPLCVLYAAAARCQIAEVGPRSPLLFLLLLASRRRPCHVVLVRVKAPEKVFFFCLRDEAALSNASKVSRY